MAIAHLVLAKQMRLELERNERRHALRRVEELAASNQKLEFQRQELQEALAHVKTLRGLLPICSYCKKVHDDRGYWDRVENYIQKHSELQFHHGICPDCIKKHFPEMASQLNPTENNPLPPKT